MSSDQFEVRFLSTEQDFIYNFGVNRGHSLSFSKINRCYFLSAEAKQLYHNISDYAWGGKRDCHPSQTILRMELGWSRGTLDKYLNELRQVGLITTESQGYNKPLLYCLDELRTIPVLIHSEILHDIRLKSEVSPERFSDLLSSYIQTDLCLLKNRGGVGLLDDVAVRQWFDLHLNGAPAQEEPSVQVSSGIIPRHPKINIPKLPDDAVRTASFDAPTTRKKASDPQDASQWGVAKFRRHFEVAYEQKYGKPFDALEKDVAQLSRLVKTWPADRKLIREYMDVYFELDYFLPKTLARFCSKFSQSVLDEYMRSGKLPQDRRSKEDPSAIPPDDHSSSDEYRLEDEEA